MNKIIQICTYVWGIFFVFLSSVCFAEESAYQIELIVYSHINETALRSEYWPELQPIAIPSTTIELTPEQILPESSWLLKNAHQKLENNHFPVLLHIAWQEPTTELRKEKTIHLFGGATYADDRRQLEGTVMIVLQHFFNVHFNLQFLLPWDSIKDLRLTNIANNGNQPFVRFKINESLRVRSNELNYIDHPLYGVLIQITPTKLKTDLNEPNFQNQ